MNPMDGILNMVSGFMEDVARWIPAVNIPYNEFFDNWGVIGQYLNKANLLFPIDTLLTVMGITFAFLGAMLVIWVIKFLKSFIPFFG